MTVTPLSIAAGTDIAAIQLQSTGTDYLPPDTNLGFPTTVIGTGLVYSAMQVGRTRIGGAPPVNSFYNVLARWNTSGMSGQTVTAAELEIVLGVGFVSAGAVVSAGWNPPGWTGANISAAHAVYAPETDAFVNISDVTWSGIVVPTTVIIPLLNPDTFVNKSGFTSLRMHMDTVQPPVAGPGGITVFGFYAWAGLGASPILRLTHSLVAPSCPVRLVNP